MSWRTFGLLGALLVGPVVEVSKGSSIEMFKGGCCGGGLERDAATESRWSHDVGVG